MSTQIIALNVFVISILFVEASGFWLIKRGRETSQHLYSYLGIGVCLIALLSLIFGIVALLL